MILLYLKSCKLLFYIIVRLIFYCALPIKQLYIFFYFAKPDFKIYDITTIFQEELPNKYQLISEFIISRLNCCIQLIINRSYQVKC